MQDRKEHIRRDLNRGAGISLAGNIFKLVEFLLTLLAARLFGVHVWGQYIFLGTLIIPGIRLSCAGMDKGIIWFVSRHHDSRLPPEFFPWIRNRMLTIGIVFILGYAGYEILSGPGGKSSSNLLDPLSLALMVLSAPFLVFTNLNLGISIAFRKIEHEVLVRGILYPVFYLGLPCAFAFLSADIRMLAFCYLIGTIAGYFWSLALAAPLRATMDKNPITDHTHMAIRTLWSYSWPMGLRDVLLSVQQRTDIWILALFLPPQAIGIYGLSLSIANSIRTVRQAFDNILLAVVASLKRGLDRAHIRDAYLHAGHTTLALGIPIFAFLVFFASPLLAISGPEYAAGETSLLIFAFTLIILGYLGLSATVVMGLGKSRWGIFNDMLCLFLNGTLNLYLVPRYGITGAALGTSIAIFLTNIAWFLECIYLIRLVPLKASILFTFVLGMVLTTGAWLLWKGIGNAGIPSRALFFGLFASGYLLAMYPLFGKGYLARRKAADKGLEAAAETLAPSSETSRDP